MTLEWTYADAAVRHVRAVLDVGIERARMELAHRASSGEIPTRGIREKEYYSILPDVWETGWFGNGLPGFEWVEFKMDKLLACFPFSSKVPPVSTPAAARRVGRKPKWDWDGIFGEALRIVHNEGVPDIDSAFADKLLYWCREQFGEEPAQSMMREKVSSWLAPVRKSCGPEFPAIAGNYRQTDAASSATVRMS